MKSFSILISVLVLSLSQRSFADDKCKLFVDQVSGWSGTYGYRGVSLFIKTHNSELNGKVMKVAFFGQIQETAAAKAYCEKSTNKDLNDCNLLGQWRSFEAHEFYSNDYYVLHLDITHQATFEHIYEGAIYVETDKGAAYWLNPAGGGNFFVDENLRKDLIRLGSGGYYRQGKRLNTADKFNYMNPEQCR